MATLYINNTDEQVIQAIIETKGYISQTAKRLGLKSAGSLRIRIKKSPVLNEVLNETRESNLDKAEHKLQESIEKGESWAILFYLKCMGKERGYSETQNINIHGSMVNANVDLSVLSLEELKQLEELAGKFTNQNPD